MTPGAAAPVRWLVDGNNVMGARPDGWWRDRAGAARRLVERLSDLPWENGSSVLVFFDGPGGDDSAGPVTVRHAGPRGTADDAIVALLADEGGAHPTTMVVTSDRELARRCRAEGAEVVGARRFLGLLEDGTELGTGAGA